MIKLSYLSQRQIKLFQFTSKSASKPGLEFSFPGDQVRGLGFLILPPHHITLYNLPHFGISTLWKFSTVTYVKFKEKKQQQLIIRHLTGPKKHLRE